MGRKYHAFGVCPAHAGVYPNLGRLATGPMSLPRTRGGLPCTSYSVSGCKVFAPHTRGSTRRHGVGHVLAGVCPAHAGVYLARGSAPSGNHSLPRTRGGLPEIAWTLYQQERFAPHTRGSTQPAVAILKGVCVCPAHAGVYLPPPYPLPLRCRLPRTRGGLPLLTPIPRQALMFAPHTRGSTAVRRAALKAIDVCPAHAGVYQRQRRSNPAWEHPPIRLSGEPPRLFRPPTGVVFLLRQVRIKHITAGPGLGGSRRGAVGPGQPEPPLAGLLLHRGRHANARLCDCHITVIMAVATSQTRGPRTKSPGASRLPEYESGPLPQRITETRWTATMRPDGPRGYSGDKPEVTKVVR